MGTRQIRLRTGLALLLASISAGAQSAQQQGRPGGDVQVGVPLGSDADQQRDRQRAERRDAPARPTPHASNGRVLLGATPTEKGLWLPGAVVPNPLGLGPDIPYQPWAKALAADRRTHQLEPHARCKPSGVVRVLLTPYGVEFVDLPELQRIYIFDVGGPHSYRTIYMDGRTHPQHRAADYYGHSIGWWEGETLVVETTGFNEGFWLDRGMLPHTERLRTVERFTRTNFETLKYELTIDDPGAYTAPFTGGLNMRWDRNTELFEYVCQEANYAHELMVGQQKSVDRSSPMVP